MTTNDTYFASRMLRLLAPGQLALSLTTAVLAQSTAFTYQGRLNNGVNPASGQ